MHAIIFECELTLLFIVSCQYIGQGVLLLSVSDRKWSV